MKVAGIGFSTRATTHSLLSALDAAGGADGLDALATATDKAEADVMTELANHLDLPLHKVPQSLLATQTTKSTSSRVIAEKGIDSVCESAALAACGDGATLISEKAISEDRLATAAIAVSGGAS